MWLEVTPVTCHLKGLASQKININVYNAGMSKLLILTSEAEQYTRLIQAANLPQLEFTTDLQDCDIVLGEPRLIRDQLPHLTHPKWIQSIYAGVETLMDPALRRDYVLTNARSVFGELMSEYVIGYLLAHEKKIFKRVQDQQAKKWDRAESGWLRGKTLGLLGVGSIGAHIANVAKAFAMNVWGFTRFSEESPNVDKYFHPLESDSLLSDQRKQASALQNFASGLDYLVIVLPRTKDTNNIVNAQVFDALPSHAVLINVGRGNAVDEPALVEALTQGKIASTVLDVTAQEPLPPDHPFWTTPNLLLTFHTSALSYPDDLTRVFIENYNLYIQGKPLKYRVDFDRGY
jgi:phosphoglycerate dehydrogenase-like enzyme